MKTKRPKTIYTHHIEKSHCERGSCERGSGTFLSPVVYYDHTDHLGGSSVLTKENGVRKMWKMGWKMGKMGSGTINLSEFAE